MKIQLFSSCLLVLFISAISAHEAVLDVEGNPLQVGGKYYAFSAIGGAGGGLGLSSLETERCPSTIILDPWQRNPGIPCTFQPAVTSTDGMIHLSTSLNVKFDPEFVPSCANTTVWNVGRLDAWTRSVLITMEGEEGNPGCATVRNWIKIEKGLFPSSYKFVFNPDDVCSDDSVGVWSSDLGITQGLSGERLLIMSSRPFEFQFIKYDGNVIRNKAAYTTQ